MLQNKLLNKTLKVSKVTGLILCAQFAASSVFAQTPINLKVDVWADNWFALYVGDELVKEDSVSIRTERSFNAESFNLRLSLPAQINFIVKDFKENDTGLEYIGSRKQQMGDGGFIAQFIDTASGKPLLVTSEEWRCLPIHIAPLNKQCAKSSTPEMSCSHQIIEEPDNWKSASFDDSKWPKAERFSKWTVRPKGGYDKVDWSYDANLIWSSDLEADNTLLCRASLTN